MEPAIRFKPFDGGDALAGRGRKRGDAGASRPAVDQHGAGAALPFAAAVLCTRKPEFVAKDLEQRGVRGGVDRVTPSVDGKLGRLCHRSPSREAGAPYATSLRMRRAAFLGGFGR